MARQQQNGFSSIPSRDPTPKSRAPSRSTPKSTSTTPQAPTSMLNHAQNGVDMVRVLEHGLKWGNAPDFKKMGKNVGGPGKKKKSRKNG